MKSLFTLATYFLVGCSNNTTSTITEQAPTITEQQLHCLNKNKEYVKSSIAANKQTFYAMEQDVYLFKTQEGRVLGYLFEQGECSAVMTQIPANRLKEAEQFIAAEVKKNYGPLFITKEQVHFKYYTAPIWQDTETYLVASSLN
jgi:hypothetical protein